MKTTITVMGTKTSGVYEALAVMFFPIDAASDRDFSTIATLHTAARNADSFHAELLVHVQTVADEASRMEKALMRNVKSCPYMLTGQGRMAEVPLLIVKVDMARDHFISLVHIMCRHDEGMHRAVYIALNMFGRALSEGRDISRGLPEDLAEIASEELLKFVDAQVALEKARSKDDEMRKSIEARKEENAARRRTRARNRASL
jgi:hypothetical protein